MSSPEKPSPEKSPKAVAFKKKTRKGNRGMRKRKAEDDDVDETVVKKAKAAKKHGLAASTAKGKKYESFAYEAKRVVGSETVDHTFDTYNQDASFDADGIAMMERQQAATLDKNADDKIYKGESHRSNWIAKKDSAGAKFFRAGPNRASAHIRMTNVVDYNPSLCKDYNESGYCAYGDSCKFVHDRTDYKSGWELDRDWEEEQRAKAEGRSLEENYESSDEDEVPTVCHICDQAFEDPVVTRCQHYFCERCALEHDRKAKKCFICEEKTFGSFSTAYKVLEKVKELEKKKAEAEQQGDDGSGSGGLDPTAFT